MAIRPWDRLQERAVDAVRGTSVDDDNAVDDDSAARRLLAMCGGDRRMVLATRLRLAAIAASRPDELNPRRALALVDRAIEMADTEARWHPVFGDVESWRSARSHAAP